MGSVLPPGFKLDPVAPAGVPAPAVAPTEGLPPGFTLDAPPAQTPVAAPQATPAQPDTEQPLRQATLSPEIDEVVGAINRGVLELPDFVISAFNQLLGGVTEVTGLETAKLPTSAELIEKLTGAEVGREGFVEPGAKRDVLQAVGTLASVAAAPAVAIRKGGTQIAKEIAERGVTEATEFAALSGAGERVTATRKLATATTPLTLAKGEVVAKTTVKDKPAIEAIKQGFGEKLIGQVKAGSDKTKQRMRKMVGIQQRGLENEAFAARNRPASVPGNVIADRVQSITQVNLRAGKGIDREAKKLANETVDFSSARNAFIDEIEEIGVRVSRVGDDLKVSLEDSNIEDIPGAAASLNLMLKRLNRAGDRALAGHKLKRFIDTQVSFGKQPGSANALDKTVERIFKNTRRNLDTALDAKFPAYKEQNEIFAETRRALDNLQDIGGKNIDFSKNSAAEQMGTLTRRIFSNAASRGRVIDAVDGLDTIAKKHGIDASDDVVALSRFADELGDVFQPAARTAFRSEIAKAGVDVGAAVATGGATGAVLQAGRTALQKVRGVNEAGALKAIKEVLK